jgi:hypothetical protein
MGGSLMYGRSMSGNDAGGAMAVNPRDGQAEV